MTKLQDPGGGTVADGQMVSLQGRVVAKVSGVRFWLLLLAAGVLLYAGALSHPFHYDDLHSIKYNPHIRSLANLPDFFTNPHTFSSQSAGFMFRPVLLISYALNYAIGGQAVAGYRCVNLLLHIACAGLCFQLILAMTGQRVVAASMGVAFLVHPAHAEVVHYISARSDVVSAALYLLAVLLLLQVQRAARVGGHLAYALGLLTKSVAITAPVLVVAWECLGDRSRSIADLARRHYGWLALAAVYVAILFLNGFLASAASKTPRGLGDHWWTQLKALAYYPLVFAMPTHLSVDHAFRVSSLGHGAAAILAGAALVSATAAILFLRQRILTLGWLWYLVALMPASLVPLNILVSERRAYLASGGLLLIGSWAWAQLFARLPRGALALGTVCVVCFSVLVLGRNPVWSSEITLWEDAAAKAPQSARAQLNLALACKRDGDTSTGLRHLQQGLALRPNYADAWVLLGDLHDERGDARAALDAYQVAISHNPGQAGVYHNLGNIHMRTGEPETAARYYAEAVRRNPYFAEARNNLGQAYEDLGDIGRAIGEYKRAVADSLYWTNTEDPVGGAWFNLARAAERLGQRELAREAYVRAAHDLGRRPEWESFAERSRQGARRLER